jgi:hypothetical protein
MPETLDALTPQQAQVYDWRFDCLRAAGLSYAYAAALASCEADLHEILRAYARGCPAALLARIYG